ncbi:MAG: hypothetical protein EOO38_16310, partial [Cytophagaceae bacterium]
MAAQQSSVLTTPLVINNKTINDGDIITIRAAVPSASSVPAATNYNGDALDVYQALALNQSYVAIQSTSNYSGNALASITHSENINFFDTTAAQTDYQQTGSTTLSAAPTPDSAFADLDAAASRQMQSDVMMTTPSAVRMTKTTFSATGSISRGSALSNTYRSDTFTNTAPITTNADVRLVVEYHDSDFVALRNVGGQYLHMKSVYDYTTTSMQGTMPNTLSRNYTVTYSSDPSELPTAQWQFVQSGNSGGIYL